MKKLDLAILLIFATLVFSYQPSSQAGVTGKNNAVTKANYKATIWETSPQLDSFSLIDSVKKMSKTLDSVSDSAKRKLPVLKSQQKSLTKQIKTIDTLLANN